MRILTWDLEIRDPVSDQYDGWEAARRGDCGISVLAVKDSDSGRIHVYDEQTLDDAMDHLNAADLLVGYNSTGFDQQVIQGISNRYITVPQYDILVNIYRAIGRRQSGWRLGDVARRTIGLEKSQDGVTAPKLVKQGRWAELFDYCMQDVFVTAQLFNHIVDFGHLIAPDGAKLAIDAGTKDYA